jgi:hypothetical protein
VKIALIKAIVTRLIKKNGDNMYMIPVLTVLSASAISFLLVYLIYKNIIKYTKRKLSPDITLSLSFEKLSEPDKNGNTAMLMYTTIDNLEKNDFYISESGTVDIFGIKKGENYVMGSEPEKELSFPERIYEGLPIADSETKKIEGMTKVTLVRPILIPDNIKLLRVVGKQNIKSLENNFYISYEGYFSRLDSGSVCRFNL